VRIFPAEGGACPDEPPLPIERLQANAPAPSDWLRVVGDKPDGSVVIGEQAEPAGFDKGLHAVTHTGETGCARQRPIQNRLGGLTRSALSRVRRRSYRPAVAPTVRSCRDVSVVILNVLEML
jgi:hypothetical protein